MVYQSILPAVGLANPHLGLMPSADTASDPLGFAAIGEQLWHGDAVEDDSPGRPNAPWLDNDGAHPCFTPSDRSTAHRMPAIPSQNAVMIAPLCRWL